MFDKLLFQPLFNTGQTVRLQTADGILLDSCDANIGVLKGKARTIPAILCDGVDESDNWQILNIVDGSGLFLDHVAVKGAVSSDQAQRLCKKYLTEAQRGQIGSQVELTHNGVKTFLDSAKTPSGALSLLAVDAPLLDSQGTINAVQWDGQGNLLSHGGRWSQMMLDMAGCDIQGDLIEQVSPRDVMAMLLGNDGEVLGRGMFDAMIIKHNQFEKTMQKIAEALKAHDNEEFFVKTVTMIEPFKRQGVVNVGIIFEMSDTQTITVLFNNPDTTPAKLTGTDILTSWKWILNKRDVTAILQPRAVDARKYPQLAARMIRVLAKNHDRFKRAQMARSKEELLLEELVGQVESAQSQLRTMQQQGIDIQKEIDAETERKQQQTDAIAMKQAEDDAAAKAADEFHENLKNALEVKDPTQSLDYIKIMDDQAQLEAWQDVLDSFLQNRMIETRNSLRGLGWDGEKFKNLSKDGHTLVMDLKQVGGGGNIVGVTYSIPTTEFTYRDDFSLSPDALAYRIDQALPEPEVVPKTTAEKKAEYRQILDELKGWVPAGQLGALAENIDSEDFESFYDQVTELQDIIKHMPAIGSTDGKGKNAVAILHYFSGGSNWYVTEADSPSDAYGYASLNGFDYEAGYMQISDIIKHAELDLNFNQETVHDLIRDNSSNDKRSKAEKLVDAAYKFDNATDLFKEFVSDSINDDDYSPFLSAKTIDEAIKASGLSVAWGIPTVDGGEVSKDGAIVARVDIGGDGKSMIFVGAEGDTRVGASEGEGFMYTADLTEHKRMVAALVRATGATGATDAGEQNVQMNNDEQRRLNLDAFSKDLQALYDGLGDTGKTYQSLKKFMQKAVGEKPNYVELDDYLSIFLSFINARSNLKLAEIVMPAKNPKGDGIAELKQRIKYLNKSLKDAELNAVFRVDNSQRVTLNYSEKDKTDRYAFTHSMGGWGIYPKPAEHYTDTFIQQVIAYLNEEKYDAVAKNGINPRLINTSNTNQLSDEFIEGLKTHFANVNAGNMGDAGQSQENTQDVQMNKDAVPVFETYADANTWIEQQAKLHGGKRIFASTEIYKAAYEQIKALYDAEKAVNDAAKMQGLADAGLKIGDQVSAFIPDGFMGGYTETGTIIEYNGAPYVKTDNAVTVSKNGRIGTTSRLAWNGQWKKVETTGDAGQSQENEQDVQMNKTEEQFLNDVIAGSLDLLADETGDRLEQIAENLDPSLEGLFAQAVEAYSQAALNNASSLKN